MNILTESLTLPIKINNNHIVCKTLRDFKFDCEIICVSLSGGVDSMVILACLEYLCRIGVFSFKLIAIHINYNNRVESVEESSFLEGWCKKNNIPIYVKNIGISRGDIDRAEYEIKTRDIRINFYKEIQVVLDCKFPILLGHHLGDVEENIISNIMKGSSLISLGGMKSHSLNFDVEFNRPLITISKSYIYDFAKLFGIPYFKDTTPKWSVRYKLRNILFPTFKNIYGSNFHKKLGDLSERSNELCDLMNVNIFEPFMSKYVKRYDKISIITFGDNIDSGVFFWSEIMKRECHRIGVGMVSSKSIKLIILKMKTGSVQKLSLKKNLDSFIDKTQLFLNKK
jgi:tRNA(Ile)-lysidine synthetase-like protein